MGRTSLWHRVLWASAALLLILTVGCAILMLPTTTLRGVNYRVTAHRIPAYVKGIDFLQRHYQYQLLVSRICAGRTSDSDCVVAIFDWTHQNIQPTPEGSPVIDDHPLHIIIRGHGESDQIADVFVTLSVYAGVPAFFKFVKEPLHGKVLPLSFALLDGKWIPFDVANHVVFRRRDGVMASVDELLNDQVLVDAHMHRLPGDLPYSAFISRDTLIPFTVPHPLRAELQQPWRRIRYELRRAVGWERE